MFKNVRDHVNVEENTKIINFLNKYRIQFLLNLQRNIVLIHNTFLHFSFWLLASSNRGSHVKILDNWSRDGYVTIKGTRAMSVLSHCQVSLSSPAFLEYVETDEETAHLLPTFKPLYPVISVVTPFKNLKETQINNTKYYTNESGTLLRNFGRPTSFAG